MINTFYEFFEKLGYVHPLHPVFTHAPIGAVIAAFCLALSGWLGHRQDLFTSAYHATIVGFVLLVPVIVIGLMDWQYYYSGAWLFQIKMKIILTVLLFVLLSITLIVERLPHRNRRHSLMLILMTLCLFNIMGLGYFGGELVYAGRVPLAETRFQPGQKVFTSHCSGCHVNGGNIFYPNLPLRSAPQLEHYVSFIEFVRNPHLPNGAKGPMPDFTQNKLSDQQAHELYDYLTHELSKARRAEINQ